MHLRVDKFLFDYCKGLSLNIFNFFFFNEKADKKNKDHIASSNGFIQDFFKYIL